MDFHNESKDFSHVPDSEVPAVKQVGVEPSSKSREVPPSRYDLRVLQSLRQIIRAVDLHSRHLLGKHQITGPQLVTLMAVERFQPVSVGALAGHIHLSASTVIGILDRLESKGFVHRRRSTKDRRLVQVLLTEKGQKLSSDAPSPLQDTLAKAMNKLSEPERVLIVESLERIVELMRMQDVEAAPILETGPINPSSTDSVNDNKMGPKGEPS